ncbi:MAG: hypothetical protein ACREUN_16285, partial [Burkholderiales bacterium]
MDQKEFERVSAAILALFPPLAETEQRLSMVLYRLLVLGKPVSTDALARAARVDPAVVERILPNLG